MRHTDPCRVEGCTRLRHYSSGLCTMHQKRLQRHGTLEKPSRKKPPKVCTMDGCSEIQVARGLCNRHVLRLRMGRPLEDPKVPDLPGEEWRPVVGYEALYSVSSYGRIRRDAPGPRTYPGKILKVQHNGRGYLHVQLSKNNRQRHIPVHRLVAAAFLGPANGLQVNHMDLNKSNNRLDNLEYVTHSENMQHAFDHGRGRLGPTRGVRLARTLSREVVVLEAQLAAARSQFGDGPGLSRIEAVLIDARRVLASHRKPVAT